MRSWPRDTACDCHTLWCQWRLCRETLPAVAPHGQQESKTSCGGAAQRPQRPSRAVSPRGGPTTRRDARRVAGPCGGCPRTAGQHGNNVPRLTASEAPGKKTSLPASERETERVQTLRTAVRATVQPLAVHRLTCVDESGITLAMIRRYGRAAPGQRGVDHVPDKFGG